jgi:penicillin-binding protein 1B
MKTWRLIAVIASTLTVLIISVSVWGYFRLDREMKIRLETREFLAPTTFWSAPETLERGDVWSPPQVAEFLRRAGYREEQNQLELSAQSFAQGDCTHLPQTYESEGSGDGAPATPVRCLSFRVGDSLHPEIRNLRTQSVVINVENVILDVWTQERSDNTWGPALRALREPTRIAQFVEGEPLLQEWAPLGEIPTSCLNAVLAIEDPRFLEHAGVNWKALARAVVVNASRGRFAQGGSTITQQMVKNFFLNSEKTVKRKLKEFAMALILESNLSKDQIFEIYLNIIYLGQSGPFQVRGYQAASQYYFQKKLVDLGVQECALLATVLNSPGQFDPFRNPEKATKRLEIVLNKMVEHQFISDTEKVAALALPLPKNSRPAISDSAPYFIEVAQRELVRGGYALEGTNVFTTMRPRRQESAQKALNEHLANLEEKNPKIKALKEKGVGLEGLVLTIDLASGNITNAVAGRGFRKSPFNRIWDARRQVGSLAKPFVFLTAFEQDPELSPLTMVNDAKVSFPLYKKSWSPENYDKKYHGEVSLNYALKNSLNASTAILGMRFDLDQVIERFVAAGVQSDIPKVPSLLLGAMDLRPIEIAEAYLSLARMGEKLRPRLLEALVFADGTSETFAVEEAERIYDVDATGMVVGIMKETNRTGTAKAVEASGFQWISAGKTGTTSDYKDAWFAGFTPWDLTLVWVGYDQPQSHGLTGGGGALPIWLRVMSEFSQHHPVEDFSFPASLAPEDLVAAPETETSRIMMRTQPAAKDPRF